MRLRWPWRTHEQKGSSEPASATSIVDLSGTVPHTVHRVQALGRQSLGAGGDIVGNAIGDGSSTTHIDQVVVLNAALARPRYERDLTPPPIGQIANRVVLRTHIESLLLESKTSAPVVFLEGYGGVGKTTLAAQICAGASVRDRYPGGVVWTSVGQARRGADLADHIGDICEYLSGQRPGTTDPTMAGATLGEILESGPSTLLVVDDVWFAEQVRPFLMGAVDSARLLNTRNRGLAPHPASVVEIGPMSAAEARAATLAGLPELDSPAVDRLLRVAKGWPVLLGLMNAALKVHLEAGGPPHEVVPWIAQLVETNGPTGLDSSAPDDLSPTVAATVATSLKFLTPDERERYLDLAIFKEDLDIPEYVLARLWLVTGSLTSEECRRVRSRLSALRLVSDRWAEGQPAVAVHDILRSYLLHRLTPEQLTERHEALVRGFRSLTDDHAGEHWWTLPAEQQFALQYLPHHLAEAGEHDELARLACDLRWIEKQVQCLGSVASAVATLREIATERTSRLAQALDRNSHVFLPDKLAPAIGATLVSRSRPLRGSRTLHGAT